MRAVGCANFLFFLSFFFPSFFSPPQFYDSRIFETAAVNRRRDRGNEKKTKKKKKEEKKGEEGRRRRGEASSSEKCIAVKGIPDGAYDIFLRPTAAQIPITSLRFLSPIVTAAGTLVVCSYLRHLIENSNEFICRFAAHNSHRGQPYDFQMSGNGKMLHQIPTVGIETRS